MTYLAEIPYVQGELADLMGDMRSWLDRNHIETEMFRCAAGYRGVVFQLGFRKKDHATAFVKAFDGWLISDDPHGWHQRQLELTPSA